MTFKKFTALKQRTVNKISITASNTFNFPSKFYNDNNLNRYRFVVIYYDKNNGAIGFKFTSNENEEHKFTLQKSSKGHGGFISVTSFFKVNDIDTKKYKGRYDWKKEMVEGIGELYIIELKEKGELI